MVRLMNRLVNGRMMNEAMDMVGHDLTNEDAENNVPNDLCEAG